MAKNEVKKEGANIVKGNENGAQAPSNESDIPTPGAGDEKKGDEPLPPIVGNPDVVSAAKEICLVIPYLKEAAQGGELMYALRSIGKNFPAGVKVIVIGDAEPWFSEEVVHIAHSKTSDNPQIDTLNKILELITSSEVPDDFIFSNDDIYFVSPVELCDIQVLKTYGKIIGDEKTVYGRNKLRTIKLLDKEGLKLRNFDTHTPFYFNKEKLVEMFEKFPEAQTDGVLLYSLYMNLHYPNHIAVDIDNLTDNWLLRLIRANAAKSDFDKYISNKKFLNNAEGGFGELLYNYLEENFGEKSIFEI